MVALGYPGVVVVVVAVAGVLSAGVAVFPGYSCGFPGCLLVVVPRRFPLWCCTVFCLASPDCWAVWPWLLRVAVGAGVPRVPAAVTGGSCLAATGY